MLTPQLYWNERLVSFYKESLLQKTYASGSRQGCDQAHDYSGDPDIQLSYC